MSGVVSTTDYWHERLRQRYPGIAIVEAYARALPAVERGGSSYFLNYIPGRVWQEYVDLPGLVARVRESPAVQEAELRRELEIRRRRMEELERMPSVHPLLPTAETETSDPPPPRIDYRPQASPRHIVRFDSSGQALDMTLTTIQDYFSTAERVGVETGGFLWGLERPRGPRTTVTRVSGPAPDSRHERDSVVLGNYSDVEGGALRADLIPLGDWHSHPSGHGAPSRADREAWVKLFQRSKLPSWTSIIAYRRHGLGGLSLAAWSTFYERPTGRYVVAPAEIPHER